MKILILLYVIIYCYTLLLDIILFCMLLQAVYYMLNLIHIKSCFFYTYMFLEIAKPVAKNSCFNIITCCFKSSKDKTRNKNNHKRQ